MFQNSKLEIQNSYPIFLSLGSNLGDRRKNIERALDILESQKAHVVKRSSFYETEPVGVTDQPWFLNMCVEVATTIAPRDLLKVCLAIEDDLGRKRHEKWGPRIIDIDILFFGSLIIKEYDVIIPHQYLHERRFVLQPLSEIAPEFVHPVLGKTMVELLTGCTDSNVVRKLER